MYKMGTHAWANSELYCTKIRKVFDHVWSLPVSSVFSCCTCMGPKGSYSSAPSCLHLTLFKEVLFASCRRQMFLKRDTLLFSFSCLFEGLCIYAYMYYLKGWVTQRNKETDKGGERSGISGWLPKWLWWLRLDQDRPRSWELHWSLSTGVMGPNRLGHLQLVS